MMLPSRILRDISKSGTKTGKHAWSIAMSRTGPKFLSQSALFTRSRSLKISTTKWHPVSKLRLMTLTSISSKTVGLTDFEFVIQEILDE